MRVAMQEIMTARSASSAPAPNCERAVDELQTLL